MMFDLSAFSPRSIIEGCVQILLADLERAGSPSDLHGAQVRAAAFGAAIAGLVDQSAGGVAVAAKP